jgi:ATP-binding cassette, subfamily B, multidrug efflux pump
VSAFRRLLRYVLRYRRAFFLGLVCVACTRAVALASPLVLGYAIDDLTRSVTRAKLAAYGALLLAIGLISGVFLFLQRRILIGASRDIEYDMRNDFFAHLETLPLAYFQTHRTGDLMSRATNDLNAVRMMIGPSIMYSANTMLTLVVALFVMVGIDARLTLWALIPMPFVSISVKVFGSAIHKRFEQIQAQLSDVSAVAQEALSGVRVVRAYRQEHAELERFRRSNDEYLRRNRRLIVLQGFFFPSMSFFLGLGALLVLWLGGREVVRGRMSVGQFVAFNSYLTMLSWPMIAFGWVTNMLQRGMASWKRMLEVLDTKPAISDFGSGISDPVTQSRGNPQSIPNPMSDIPNVRGSIEFRDLVFSYGDLPVLNHVSATIAAGETVALVGVTGSGKTTLISLLARLHDPPPGTVFIDGFDVRDLPLATLRGAIGFVPQEPFLFSDTLGDNVAFGLDAIGGAGWAGQAGAAGTTSTDAAGLKGPRYASQPDGAVAGVGGAAARVNDTAAGVRSATLLGSRDRRDDVPPDAGLKGPRYTSRTDDAVDVVRSATLLGSRDPRDERIRAAAAVARLDKDVADFPRGYDTMVGERGITLSGGQKQRTALARAVAIDPRILILDDALSAVDTYTEEEILARLRTVMRERTSIIVSHRISTVRDADRIFVLDDGRIVEQGTHDELIRHNGLYAELHRKQLLEEELAAS